MLMDTKLCHGYSFNTWSDVVTYDDAFIRSWLASPQTSMYYSLQVMQDTQAKDDALAALEGTDFNSMFGFEEWDNQGDKEITEMFNGPDVCVGCAE